MSDLSPETLKRIARQVLHGRDFNTDFPAAVLAEMRAFQPTEKNSPHKKGSPRTAPLMPPSNVKRRDLTHLLWSSIDNDDSKDLDQIESIERIHEGSRVYVGIADVYSFVPQESATDRYAQANTTSIYTPVEIFPMLPPVLSTDLTSLNENQNRYAVVIEMDINLHGHILRSDVYPALVRNKFQLTYAAVSMWLEKTPPPYSAVTKTSLEKLRLNRDLQKQIILQEKVARALRAARRVDGALEFHATQIQPSVASDGKISMVTSVTDRASHIIEEFMIASNKAVDAFLTARKLPCIQRVVRVPKNWLGMVEVAATYGEKLPFEPDGKALQKFLAHQEKKDPVGYPDLSLAMIKLLGRGEYAVKVPGEAGLGHFALAASNYSHTTAPNRRYPDLLLQRILYSVFENRKLPYSIAELQALAAHCTAKEDDANRVERQVSKCLMAASVVDRVGEQFTGVITAVLPQGVFVRVLEIPLEGKLEGGVPGLEVGEHGMVRLRRVDPYRGLVVFEPGQAEQTKQHGRPHPKPSAAARTPARPHARSAESGPQTQKPTRRPARPHARPASTGRGTPARSSRRHRR